MNWLETFARTAPYLALWETAYGQMMIAKLKRSPLSYLALWETAHGQMMIAMPKRSPLSKLPSPTIRRMMKVAKVGITLQMSMNQFTLAIWYPCYFSNNLNVWKLCSTIAEKCEEAKASSSWILLHKMSKSMGGLRMPISVVEGNRRPHDLVQAAKFSSEVGVLARH